MSSATAEPRDHGSESGPDSEPVRVEHGDGGPTPSRAVVEAVAGAAGVEPVELADSEGIVLYEYVDPDALDALVSRRSDTDVDVSFSVAEYAVSVDATTVVAERTR